MGRRMALLWIFERFGVVVGNRCCQLSCLWEQAAAVGMQLRLARGLLSRLRSTQELGGFYPTLFPIDDCQPCGKGNDDGN